MVISRWLAVGALISITFGAPSARAGKLDDAASAARGDSPSRDSERETESADASDSTETECGELCFELVRFVLLAPWTIPRELLSADEGSPYAYADYPYQGSSRSLIHFSKRPSYAYPRAEQGYQSEARTSSDQAFAVQLDLEAGTAFDVHRSGVGLRLMMPTPVELDARWFGLWERQPGLDDYAAFGQEHLTWRFAQSGSVQFRTGVGLQHFIENSETPSQDSADRRLTPEPEPEFPRPFVHHVGGDFFYGFEALVGDPLVFSGQLHLGWVGSAFVWQARSTLGVMLGPVEAYAGYHHISLGEVRLGGPAAGARLWW